MFPLAVALSLAAPVPKAPPPAFELRDGSGTVLISTTDLTAYDWATHTLTVSVAAKEKLANDPPAEFVLMIHGREAYRGKFWRATADEPCPGPVILLGDTPAGEIRIDFNYGGPDPTEKDDVRRNAAVREALERAGKLK
jgi:hypothetical protein